MKITKILAAVGLLAFGGTAASAATFVLDDAYRPSAESHTFYAGGLSMTVYGYNGNSESTVRTHSGYGLSVGHHLINGHEGVMLHFSKTVSMDSFTASYVDWWDNYEVFAWGGYDWHDVQSGYLTDNYYTYGTNYDVETVDIYSDYASSWFWIGTGDHYDEFKLRDVSVSAVPLPAGGVLLLSALGLVALRRKKS